MDDIFQQGEPVPHRRTSRVLIAGGAVLILVAGFLVLKYHDRLFPPSPSGLPGMEGAPPQRAGTPEEKAQLLRLLQQGSSTSAQAGPTTPQERAQILRRVSTHNSPQSASQPSSEEKMKLLQSLQH